MPTADAIEQVQTLYVAYYGRPGDPGGVDFWAAELDASGGNLSALVDAFGNSEEFIDHYGNLDSEELVNTLFRQILGREADPEGLQFYLGILDSGAKSLASIALDIANGVQGDDVVTLNNKLAVAQVYTNAIADSGAAYGEAELDAAKSLMATIGSDSASVQHATLVIAAAQAAEAGEDVAGDSSSGVTVAVNQPVAGTLDFAGDVDVFQVELQAGVEYLIDLAGRSSLSGTLLDPTLGLFLDSSDFLAFDDDAGRGHDARLTYTPDTTDTYYLSVQAYDETGTGTYFLSVDRVGNDTIAGDNSSGESLLVGTTVSSHIDAAEDEDWFYIELSGGTQYTLYLTGADSGDGSLADPALSLYDAQGVFLTEDDANTLDSKIVYTPALSGGFYLVAASGDGGIGTYTLTAREPFNRTPLTITFDDPAGELDAYRDDIEANIRAAWDNWDEYIDGETGAVLDIVVAPFYEEGDDVALAFAGAEGVVWLYDDVWQGLPGYELSTGIDDNGALPDGYIGINTYILAEEDYFDFAVNGTTPHYLASFEDTMTHELGHILGFSGRFDGRGFSPFETWVDLQTFEFSGAHAVAANGGPVALDMESLLHLDQQAFPLAIMTPVQIFGEGDPVSDVEIAILADIGIPIHEQYLMG